ncbi:hypothetical protein CPB84DRAFT_1817665 [Gymnopilus junonius]|uniref:Uncharacterized protein n=1 Tax=Gymnopilus junonius TaxID=109634 RepID=A0A9P5TG29_GYMJU|nr:hypothetical protein CPB84DRAFT_1817665 [Gymnopilus junonius]
MPKDPKHGNNPSGRNQHHSKSIFEEIPDLCELLQGYINVGIQQKAIPACIERERGVTIKQAASNCAEIYKRLQNCNNKMHAIKEKLALKGVHITQDSIMEYQRAENEKAAKACNPNSNGSHPHGIWSIGPNEEWCIDGHEKILKSMGVAVWGIADKCMSISMTMDKGTEVGKLISLVQSMRALYCDISEELLPSFCAVKSTSNITRERNWHPLYEKELSNIAYEYEAGKVASGFHQVALCRMISYWLWGQIVQAHLDKVVEENQSHKIWKQKDILLPSGHQCINIYKHPEDHDLMDCLIKYNQPDLLQFRTDKEVVFCKELYVAVGSPELRAKFGWKIFCDMVNYCVENMGDYEEEEEN